MHHFDPIIKNVPGEGPAGPKPAGVVSPFRILPQAGLRADFVIPPPHTHTRAVDPLDPPLLYVTRLAFTWSDLNHEIQSTGLHMVQ